MAIRIVSDSSSNLFEMPGVDYRTVPLKVMFGSHEYVDNGITDTAHMMHELSNTSGPSTTSCPNAQEWLDAFEGASEIFAITISANLSGSYEAANLAKQLYQAAHPEAKIHIFDSKATGGTMGLLIVKLAELIEQNKTYDEILADVLPYYESHARILYSLESLANLARNGRVSTTTAMLAGVLGIRVIGHASDQGTVEIIHKVRGTNKALKTCFKEMQERGYAGGCVRIDHCLNSEAAAKLAKIIQAKYPEAHITISPCGVLCSYYADNGGLIIGYEVA